MFFNHKVMLYKKEVNVLRSVFDILVHLNLTAEGNTYEESHRSQFLTC
jgi:hypothetical protein